MGLWAADGQNPTTPEGHNPNGRRVGFCLYIYGDAYSRKPTVVGRWLTMSKKKIKPQKLPPPRAIFSAIDLHSSLFADFESQG